MNPMLNKNPIRFLPRNANRSRFSEKIISKHAKIIPAHVYAQHRLLTPEKQKSIRYY